jgi:hypothetical protein
MKKNKLFNKIIYSILLATLILSNSVGTAQALFGGGPSIPSTAEIINEVETHYGFDGNVLRRSQRKGDYPQAEVFFDKTSPKEGEKVTATALPKYFKNSNSELYYTWFLFREGEDDIEKAKQLAMGLVARGDFNPYLFESDYNIASDDSGAYEASFGGHKGAGGKKDSSGTALGSYEFTQYIDPVQKQVVDTSKITRCYRHNFGFSQPEDYSEGQPGEDLIVECEHKFPDSPEEHFFDVNDKEIDCSEGEFEVGDGEFSTKEAGCWRLNPENPDTDGDGFVDEADLAGLGQQQLTWNYEIGDRVGVIIEGTSMVPINETTQISQTKLNPLIVYSCGRAFDDDNYCVDADGNVGRCGDEVCNIKTACADPSVDVDEPCVTSTGEVGVCSFTGATGSCDAVLECTDPDSSEGDLCEKDSIPGICSESECVISRCGESGDKCQTDLGTIGVCSESGLCLEESVGAGDRSMNPYYKIMWAGVDICDREKVEGDDKKELFEEDECGGSADYGFTYLATQKVSEMAESILKPTLISNISQAQVNTENFGYSDYITVKAVFNEEEGIDPDFLDYEWKISITDEDDTPKSGFSYTNITSADWVEGDLAEGLGATEIKIRGAGDSFEALPFDTEDLYYSISLAVDYGGKSQITILKVPIKANDIEIDFLDQSGSLICDDIDDNYGKICPVYPGQLLFAKSDSSSVDGFSWELNGNKLLDKSSVYTPPFSESLYDTYSVIPVTGSDMSLQTVTLKAKKENGDEVISERLISVAKPMARISSELESAWPVTVDDGSTDGVESENVFGFSAGEDLHFKANLVPNYMSGNLTDHGIELKWYINNQAVDDNFVADNPDNDINISSSEELKFKLLGTEGDSINLGLKVIKTYTDDEKELLKEAWGITNIKNQTFQKTITLKKNFEAPTTVAVEGNSISIFMASTFKNAPEYFVFIIKTSIVFVLFWSLLYGFEYWFSQEIKLKKEND